MRMRAQEESGSPRPAVALGVSGSIAAYKSVELASRLTQAGVDVHVLMTGNATRLVAPLTFMTVSRFPVTVDLWEIDNWRPQHVALAELVDLLLVAPATANFLGKLAGGIADDALSTFALSFDGPVMVAPAMNPRMWAHPAVRDNCRRLAERGVRFVGPEPGRVACGDLEEAGRMSEPPVILRAVSAALRVLGEKVSESPRRRILVTAGPTVEPLDPVRFVGNRSSGRMGYAVAECAVAAGHEVTLISGPAQLPRPAGCRFIPVNTAEEMARATREQFANADLLVMAAAVADYRPAATSPQKIKKEGSPEQMLRLVETEDILRSLAAGKRQSQVIVGFAAETENLAANALAKLRRKKLDWLVANDVSRTDVGFASQDNEATLYGADGSCRELARADKQALAARILARVLRGKPKPLNP